MSEVTVTPFLQSVRRPKIGEEPRMDMRLCSAVGPSWIEGLVGKVEERGNVRHDDGEGYTAYCGMNYLPTGAQ